MSQESPNDICASREPSSKLSNLHVISFLRFRGGDTRESREILRGIRIG